MTTNQVKKANQEIKFIRMTLSNLPVNSSLRGELQNDLRTLQQKLWNA